MKKEIVASYLVNCIGVPPSDVELTADLSTVEVSLTVYKDGKRDVGCTFLSNKICQKFGINRNNSRCKHLFPEESLD